MPSKGGSISNRIQSFEDLIVWQKAHALVLEVYRHTSSYPKCEEFALKNQTRRAVVSVPSNIAEGFKRKSTKDSINFYNIAAASLEEARYQIILARDLNYISADEAASLAGMFAEVARILAGWIKSHLNNIN